MTRPVSEARSRAIMFASIDIVSHSLVPSRPCRRRNRESANAALCRVAVVVRREKLHARRAAGPGPDGRRLLCRFIPPGRVAAGNTGSNGAEAGQSGLKYHNLLGLYMIEDGGSCWQRC